MDSRVREIIDKSKKVVFFGGAGVSTESNIPDFRSESGLYQAMNELRISTGEHAFPTVFHEAHGDVFTITIRRT